MKSFPTLATVLLEIYWSINSQSLGTTPWLCITCFLRQIQWEAATNPVFHFPTRNTVPARGGGGWDVQLRSLEALGLGDRLKGLLGHMHEGNCFSLLTHQLQNENLCPHCLSSTEAESTGQVWGYCYLWRVPGNQDYPNSNMYLLVNWL